MPNNNSPSGLSAHCDHTRPLRVLVISPFMGFPPTMLSVGPAGPVEGGGGGSATANWAVSKPSTENTATAAISMTFGIPSSSFIKITTTRPDEYLLLMTTNAGKQSQGLCSH